MLEVCFMCHCINSSQYSIIEFESKNWRFLLENDFDSSFLDN